MFDNFPKRRIELPAEYKKIYQEHYVNNREGKTPASFFSQLMEAWLHKNVAQDVKKDFSKSTLEIGAGTLNQLNFENTINYDIVEPFAALYSQSSNLDRIKDFYSDITDIGISKSYDRITSIAVFEHIENLPEVVAKTCLLLNKNGTLRVSIPNEGTLLWKWGWRISGIEFQRKYGLDYSILMKYEHVNTADEIDEILKYFYKNIKMSCYGINRKVAFYRFYECRQPNVDLAKAFLEK